MLDFPIKDLIGIIKKEYGIKIFFAEDYPTVSDLEKGTPNFIISHLMRAKPPLVETPKIKIETGEIVFFINFLAFSWAVLYYLLTYYEKIHNACVKLICEGDDMEELPAENRSLAENGEKLFFWALSLKMAYSTWPVEILKINFEDQYHKGMNRIWAATIASLFTHEYGHVKLKHAESNSKNEKDADLFALEVMLTKPIEKGIRRDRILANMLGLMSSVAIHSFLVGTMDEVFPQYHIGPVYRMDCLIKHIEKVFSDEELTRYAKTFGAITIIYSFKKLFDIDIKHDVPHEKLWENCLEEVHKHHPNYGNS